PTIALSPRVCDKGAPGGGEPAASPESRIVPIGVPSALKISKDCEIIAFRLVSAMDSPGLGAGRRLILGRVQRMYPSQAGRSQPRCPLFVRSPRGPWARSG